MIASVSPPTAPPFEPESAETAAGNNDDVDEDDDDDDEKSAAPGDESRRTTTAGGDAGGLPNGCLKPLLLWWSALQSPSPLRLPPSSRSAVPIHSGGMLIIPSKEADIPPQALLLPGLTPLRRDRYPATGGDQELAQTRHSQAIAETAAHCSSCACSAPAVQLY